jgi:small subunit ribosomal protein S17
MAETPEETPETTEETAPETLVDEVETAAGEGQGEPTTAASADEVGRGDERGEADDKLEAAAPSTPATTRRDNLEQRRAARRAEAGKRPQRTPEERDAERREERKRKAAQRTRYRARLKTKRAERRAAEPAQEPDHAPEHGPGRAKVRTGLVVSDKADKTIVVRIDYQRRHKRYRKILRSSVTLHAHDERNDANAGDTVRVQECRPMSRSKRWRLVDVLERAK